MKRGSSSDTLCQGCKAKNHWLRELPVHLAGGGNDACGESIALQVGLQDARVHARYLVLLFQACVARRRGAQQFLSMRCLMRYFVAGMQTVWAGNKQLVEAAAAIRASRRCTYHSRTVLWRPACCSLCRAGQPAWRCAAS